MHSPHFYSALFILLFLSKSSVILSSLRPSSPLQFFCTSDIAGGYRNIARTYTVLHNAKIYLWSFMHCGKDAKGQMSSSVVLWDLSLYMTHLSSPPYIFPHGGIHTQSQTSNELGTISRPGNDRHPTQKENCSTSFCNPTLSWSLSHSLSHCLNQVFLTCWSLDSLQWESASPD